MVNDYRELYIKVKDGSGEDYVCPVNAIKNIKALTPEEIDFCVDSGTVNRYAGDIRIHPGK